MSILKNRSKGSVLTLVAASFTLVGLIAYAIALVDACTTTNELIPAVVISGIVAVAFSIVVLIKPEFSFVKAIIPIACSLSFMSIAYSVVFYIVSISAKLAAYLSPAKVVALVLLGLAMVCSCVVSFMKDTKA